jgi:hypothetical protein
MKDPHTFDRAEISKARAEGIGKRMSVKKQVLAGVVGVGAVIGGVLLGLFVWCESENSRCGA